jgi:NADH:ubiquinone oxidoreductase subunit C
MDRKEIEKKDILDQSVRMGERLIAISCIDNKDHFEFFYHFEGKKDVESLHFKMGRDEGVPSISEAFPGALLFEREIHDLFGIRFEGNKDIDFPLVLPDDYDKKPPMRSDESG